MSQEFLFFKPNTSKEELKNLEEAIDNRMESNNSPKEDTLEIVRDQINLLLSDLILIEAKVALHTSATSYQKNLENDGDNLISTFEENKNTFNKFIDKEILLNAPEKYYLQEKLHEASERAKKLADEIDLNQKFINEKEYEALILDRKTLVKRIEDLELLLG